MEALPVEVRTTVSSYLFLVDQHLPGRVEGLYLVGSVALNDFQPGRSDIDFVAVASTPLAPTELRRLGQVHRELRRNARGPKLDGIYVSWGELAASPVNLSAPFCLEGRFRPDKGFAANPVTWMTLKRYPVSLRGPARPTVWHDDELLCVWCRENVQGYWTEWVKAARTRLHRQLFTLTSQAVVWGVLGVTRLHATIKQGDIISKSTAGIYALENFPTRWSRIIEEARDVRLNSGASRYRNIFSRRQDALAFMEHVIADACGNALDNKPTLLTRLR